VVKGHNLYAKIQKAYAHKESEKPGVPALGNTSHLVHFYNIFKCDIELDTRSLVLLGCGTISKCRHQSPTHTAQN